MYAYVHQVRIRGCDLLEVVPVKRHAPEAIVLSLASSTKLVPQPVRVLAVAISSLTLSSRCLAHGIGSGVDLTESYNDGARKRRSVDDCMRLEFRGGVCERICENKAAFGVCVVDLHGLAVHPVDAINRS